MMMEKTLPRTERQLGRDMKKLLNPEDPVVARAKREIHRMKVELGVKQHEALDLWAQKNGFPTYTQWLRNHKGN